jgi:ferredoxin
MANKLQLPKKGLGGFLAQIGRSYKIHSPKKRGMEWFFEENAEPDLDGYANCAISAREFFLPRREILAKIEGENVVEQADASKPRLIFGARPCDARAIALLDKVFNWDNLVDPYFKKNRDNTVLAVLACGKPQTACFCSSVGGGPDDRTGADIFMEEEGDSLIIEALTKKGEDILARIEKPLSAAPAGKKTASKKQAAMKADAKKVSERLDGAFSEKFWADISETCLGCGACTFLCPTCHCFDITDEVGRSGGARVRSWDCCAFPLFTLHGSGHNPRPSSTERLRQRVMHKFNYTVKNFGEIFCVGCGRCVRKCPACIDLREAAETITRS